MRSALAALGLLALSGCFGHGCWASDRAETWVQPALWDWLPDPALGLQTSNTSIEGEPWPDPPAAWRGGHGVTLVSRTVRDGYDVRLSAVRGELMVAAFLPQKMKADDRAEAIRATVAGASDATPAQVEDTVQKLMAADDGGDSTGRFMTLWTTDFGFDLPRLAALGDWTPSPVAPGTWDLTHGDWRVGASLESRSIGGTGHAWRDEVRVDAGGFVRGPMLDAALDDETRRENTTALLARWAAPAPTYEGAGTEEQRVCT